MSDPVEVACDESGNDGENLFGGNATVFVDASLDLDSAAAEDVMNEMRAATRSRAAELKSITLLAPANRTTLLRLLAHPNLSGRVSIHLSEKRYFLVGKLVDLVIEEVMHERGEDIYRDRRARKWAWALYDEAPTQLGELWEELLEVFNAITRIRPGTDKTAEVQRFYRTLDDARTVTSGLIANLFRLLHAGRHHVEELAQDSTKADPDRLLDLHPVFATLGQAARTWHERTGRPVALIHDEAPALTRRRGELLINGLRGSGTSQLGLAPVPLLSVETVDSKEYSRVQLADLFAGIARRYAEMSLAGVDDAQVLEMLRPHLNDDSVWADRRSWGALIGLPFR